MLVTKQGVIPSVAASFVSSYCALWLALLYDALATIYNWLYEQLSKTDDAAEDAEADEAESAEADTDALSQM